MASKVEKQATPSQIRDARHIIDLKVNEVSVVDRPAIRREFVVVKRLDTSAWQDYCPDDELELADWGGTYVNDLPDSAFLHVEPGGKQDADGKTAPRSLRHFPYKDANGKIDLPHLRNALARIPQSSVPDDVKERATAEARRMLEQHNKEKRLEDSKVNIQEVEQTIRKMYAEAGLVLTEKALPAMMKDSAGTISTWLKTMAEKADSEEAKMKLGQAAVMLADFGAGKVPAAPMAEDKAFPPKPGAAPGGPPAPGAPPMPPKKPEEDPMLAGGAPKTKALSLDDGDSVIVKVDSAGNTHVLTKGAKQLTNARLSQLSEAAKQMLGLIKDADEEAFKSLVSQIQSNKEMPTLGVGGSPDSGVRPTGEGTVDKPQQVNMRKSDDAVLAKLDEVLKRVDTIEKARSPSTSVDGGGRTQQTTEVKKSFWKGVL